MGQFNLGNLLRAGGSMLGMIPGVGTLPGAAMNIGGNLINMLSGNSVDSSTSYGQNYGTNIQAALQQLGLTTAALTQQRITGEDKFQQTPEEIWQKQRDNQARNAQLMFSEGHKAANAQRASAGLGFGSGAGMYDARKMAGLAGQFSQEDTSINNTLAQNKSRTTYDDWMSKLLPSLGSAALSGSNSLTQTDPAEHFLGELNTAASGYMNHRDAENKVDEAAWKRSAPAINPATDMANKFAQMFSQQQLGWGINPMFQPPKNPYPKKPYGGY